MRIRSFLFFLFASAIPILIIFINVDSYQVRTYQELLTKIEGALQNRLDGVDSNISWQTIIFVSIIFILAYKFILKRTINNFKEKMSAEEKRKSYLLLLYDMFNSLIIWGGLYSITSFLNINTPSYFDSINLVLGSVLIAELIRVYGVVAENKH